MLFHFCFHIIRCSINAKWYFPHNSADRKKEIPSPEDELWRLNHISKTGVVYKRALENNVRTVKDFLQLYHTDAKKMQSVRTITYQINLDCWGSPKSEYASDGN